MVNHEATNRGSANVTVTGTLTELVSAQVPMAQADLRHISRGQKTLDSCRCYSDLTHEIDQGAYTAQIQSFYRSQGGQTVLASQIS